MAGIRRGSGVRINPEARHMTASAEEEIARGEFFWWWAAVPFAACQFFAKPVGLHLESCFKTATPYVLLAKLVKSK